MKMATQSHTASELPLEELLALYGYTVSDPEKETCHMAASLPDMTLDKDQITEDLFPGEEGEESSADDLTPSVTSNTSELLRCLQGGDKDTSVSSSDEDSDEASGPSNEEHKEIMVGSMYQAKIPPVNPYTYHETTYSEDQLLWRPGALPVQEVEEFLQYAQRPRSQKGAACTQPKGVTVRDNEQALYELVKCNFNAEEALRRLCFNVKVFSEELCAWSEEECRNFEHGYRVYGKNFHLIQANKVRTRSVGECVEYYYMWKKSDRHEYFTQQTTRLSRRRFNLQSGNMEDGEQEGEVGEVGELEGSNNSSGLLSHSSMGNRQLESPLPPQSSLDLDKPGGGPSPAQTNSPLSLKAMNWVQTGHRKQAGPADGELVMGLSEDLCGGEGGCPQQLFGCPFSLLPMDHLPDPGSGIGCCPSVAPVGLQSQPSPLSLLWANGSPPSCHHDNHHRVSGSCSFYQLHTRVGGGGPFLSEGLDCGTTATGGVGAGSPYGLQLGFSLSPSASPPSSSSALLPSHFQVFGSLLHPSPPIQHPRSLTP